MAEKMSQFDVDKLVEQFRQMESDNELIEVKYHFLICVYCKEIIWSTDTQMHCLLSNDICKNGENNHMYVSEEWLNDRKINPNISGWRRKKIISNPRVKKYKATEFIY